MNDCNGLAGPKTTELNRYNSPDCNKNILYTPQTKAYEAAMNLGYVEQKENRVNANRKRKDDHNMEYVQ